MGKIRILSTHNLVSETAAVCWKITTFCPLTFLNYDAAVDNKMLKANQKTNKVSRGKEKTIKLYRKPKQM